MKLFNNLNQRKKYMSIYFVKEEELNLTVELIGIYPKQKFAGKSDPTYITAIIDIYLGTSSSSKLIGQNTSTNTYLSDPLNRTTQLYLKRSGEPTSTEILVANIFGSRDPGEAVSSSYNLKMSANSDNNKVILKGFSMINGVLSYPAVTGDFTILASPVTPEDPDNPDEPEDLIPELDYNNISVTVTDEEWEWLKGLANE